MVLVMDREGWFVNRLLSTFVFRVPVGNSFTASSSAVDSWSVFWTKVVVGTSVRQTKVCTRFLPRTHITLHNWWYIPLDKSQEEYETQKSKPRQSSSLHVLMKLNGYLVKTDLYKIFFFFLNLTSRSCGFSSQQLNKVSQGASHK